MIRFLAYESAFGLFDRPVAYPFSLLLSSKQAADPAFGLDRVPSAPVR